MDNSKIQTSGSLDKHRTPSKETCQNIIRRILTTEEFQNGRNKHFRSASDFMNYFESLYIASPSLTKQVQRSLKAMDMPKDEDGFLLVNTTREQFLQNKKIGSILADEAADIEPKSLGKGVFISVPSSTRDYLANLLLASDSFAPYIITILPTYNGIIIFTDEPEKLSEELKSIM